MKNIQRSMVVILFFSGMPCYADTVDTLGQALNELIVQQEHIVKERIVDQKFIVQGCEKEEAWLKKYGSTYRDAIAQTQKTFKKLQDDARESTLFKSKIAFAVGADMMALYKNAKESSKATGERLTLKDSVDGIKKFKASLVRFGTALEKLNYKVDPEDKKALLSHMRMMVLLEGSLLPDVLDFMKKYSLVFTDKEQYELMVDLYRINIGYVEFILSTWDKGSLTGGNKADFDRAVNYCAYVKPYLDDAEIIYKTNSSSSNDKKEAFAFVDNINGLSLYLQALLCRKKALLIESGFDYVFAKRMNDDETNRSWHLPDVIESKGGVITAPWDRTITYKPGNVLLWNELGRPKVAVDKNGRPIMTDEKEWATVDKSSLFYRHYYIELAEMAEVIKDYDADAKKDQKEVFKSIQNLRKQFVVSGVHKYKKYLDLAVKNEKIGGKDACEACFRFDICGQRTGATSLIAQYDPSVEWLWSDDEEVWHKNSTAINNYLETIRSFLVRVGEKNALNELEAIKAYKKQEGC